MIGDEGDRAVMPGEVWLARFWSWQSVVLRWELNTLALWL